MSLGFVGIGTMGWPMAANLIRAGHRVLAFDLDREKRAGFAQTFAQPEPSSLAEIGASVEIVITMLPRGRDVRQAIIEAEGGGIASTLRPGSVVIDMSSAEPVGTRALGQLLASRGIALVDAPVSGAVAGATDGTLTIMAGSDDAATLEQVRPVLSAMGKRIFATGPLGSGHAMKALNNFLGATSFAATAEALIVGRRFGLDPATMIEIINVSTGRSFNSEVSFKNEIVPGTFRTNFALGLLTKDVGIATDLADDIGVAAPVGHLVRDLLQSALDRLGAAADHSRAFQVWEQLRSS